MSQIVEVNGVAYIAVQSKTPSAYRASGHPNIAMSMEKNGIVSTHVVQRPNGSAFYEVNEFKGRVYSKPFRVA